MLHVLRDGSLDTAALLTFAPGGGGGTTSVARQYVFEPYGQVIAEEAFGSSAHNRLGHHGLFFDRLDAGAPSAALAVNARGLYHSRNRSYDPRLGRFTSADPNGTGEPLLQLALLGRGVGGNAEVGGFSAEDHFGDGMSVYACLRSGPLGGQDPMGLYDLEDGYGPDDAYEDVSDLLGLFDPLPGPGDYISGMLEALVTDYSENLSFDVEWSSEWGYDDDDHSRIDNSWILVALGRGLYSAFDIGIPFSDTTVNPFDAFASGKRKKAGGGGGSVRTGSVRGGYTIHVQRGQQAHQSYKLTLGSGYKFEVPIGKGKRVDAIDWNSKIVRELKPDTPSGRTRGVKQLWEYVKTLEDETGDKWTGYLDLYQP